MNGTEWFLLQGNLTVHSNVALDLNILKQVTFSQSGLTLVMAKREPLRFVL